jgi:hypothetical protein
LATYVEINIGESITFPAAKIDILYVNAQVPNNLNQCIENQEKMSLYTDWKTVTTNVPVIFNFEPTASESRRPIRILEIGIQPPLYSELQQKRVSELSPFLILFE